MKRICCMIMIFALLLPMATPAFATESAVTDVASYIEEGTGDTIRVETVDISSSAAVRKNLSPDVFSTRIVRNNTLEELLYVDVKNNMLRHEYPDGSVKTEALSNVVSLSAAPSIEETSVNVLESGSSIVSSRTDYILNEPFDIEQDTGFQVSLPGQPTYSGYQAMGCRGGYFYAPTTYGYLQRKNSGAYLSYESQIFTFSPGTTIATAASIIYAVISESGIGIVISIIVTILLNIVADVIDHNWNATFKMIRYRWDYRIRLNSDTGPILDTNYRTREYWRGYSMTSGDSFYNYRGSAYDGGFLLSNTEMINLVLDEYIASQSR